MRRWPWLSLPRYIRADPAIRRMSQTAARTPRVLSLQSSTVHGFVGNKAATFPLQCLGFDVLAIDTIELSNRPGYSEGFTGRETDPDHILELMRGLTNNSLCDFDLAISGYVRSVPVLLAVGQAIASVKGGQAPNCLHVCDPVLGDNGQFYVPAALLSAYRDNLIPKCDVVTPNVFETAALTGITVASADDAREACRRLHALGPRYVFLKGVHLTGTEGPISIVASDGQSKRIFAIDSHRLTGNFSGCGDLCTALIAAWLSKSNFNLPSCLEHVSSSMYSILAQSAICPSRELKLIESRESIVNPPVSQFQVYSLGGKVSGVIFDMDGTLTEPGAINFDAMYERIGINKRKDIDILRQIDEELHCDLHAGAHAIIVDEELKGCDAMQLKPDLKDMVQFFTERKIRIAISTRNCAEAYNRFKIKAEIEDGVFHPVLSRESLGGINKPDPKVALHIISEWELSLTPKEVWFVGDSLDDMKCGKNAGCRTCLISNNELYDKSVYNNYVDLCVSSLSDFLDHLQYHDI
jgi:pyridoxine kinase